MAGKRWWYQILVNGEEEDMAVIMVLRVSYGVIDNGLSYGGSESVV